MSILVVVDNPSDWPLDISGVSLVSARAYLGDAGWCEGHSVKVFNLCKYYRYQSLGYYVSLLAEARGHKPLPRVSTTEDLQSQNLVRLLTEDLDALVQKSLAPIKSDSFEISIYFGRNMARCHEKLSHRLFTLLQAPLPRAPLRAPPRALATAQRARHRRTRKRWPPRFDIAILHDPQAIEGPSNARALQKFEKAAEEVGLDVELLTRADIWRLPESDALFIRDTTYANHYTWRFSRRAAAEGLVLIDDPESILKCNNKVYLLQDGSTDVDRGCFSPGPTKSCCIWSKPRTRCPSPRSMGSRRTFRPRYRRSTECCNRWARASCRAAPTPGWTRPPTLWPHAHAAIYKAYDRGFDPGALVIARDLAKAFAAPLQCSTTSRLLIDLNRSAGHPALCSEATRPASAAVRRAIFEAHYLPYRARIEAHVAGELATGRRVVHIASHSFTPVLDGEVRNADIGLLYDPRRSGEVGRCRRWQAQLKTLAPGWRVRRNYPYAGRSDGLTAYLRKRFPPDVYLGVELESNHGHVLEGGRDWRRLRADAVASLRAALAGD